MDRIIKYSFFILILITLFAGLLRFYNINKIPVSLYWDEVSLGYNSYSIANTTKDEYGKSFPFIFKAFNDYKFPGTVYLMVPVIKIFGLNETTTRFTSAFFGTFTVFLLFFFAKELLLKTKLKTEKITIISLISSFSLAISPWHIQFSRGEFEANIALSFVIFGVYLLFRGIRNKTKSFYVSMVILPLSFTFYRSTEVFLPLLLFSFFIIFRNEFFNIKYLKEKILGSIIFIIIMIPTIFFIFSSNSQVRTNQVSIFNNSQNQTYNSAKEFNSSNLSLLDKVIYNRRLTYVSIFLQGYFQNFSPKFLFLQGDGNLRHSIKGMGMLYLYELPFFIFGLFYLFHLSKKIFIFVVAWILIAPIPAALSIPSPHALRSLNMIPMPQLLFGMGFTWFFSILPQRSRLVMGGVFLLIAGVSFYYYLFQYYVVTPKYSANDWGDGYKQLTNYVFAHEDNYDKVIISGYKWQPYIYFLFYKKYDPSLFQQFGSNKGFYKYIFGGTSWDKDQYSLTLDNVDLKKMSNAKKVLVALSPQEYLVQKNNINRITEIRNSNNEVAFIMGNLK